MMKRFHEFISLNVILVVLATTLLALRMGLQATSIFATQNGIIRCTLSILFAGLILLRPKQQTQTSSVKPLWLIAFCAMAGVLCIVLGLIIPLRQFEWIGVLLLLFACLRSALPNRFFRDIPLALLVLYWANPLPSPWFGKLQIGMQIASVEGSEWLLHILNVRTWADGLILRTDINVFEIPAWCSGMRTATTVFILALALGILRHLKGYETAILIVWSLFHALLLNILRISAMVALSRYTHSVRGLAFLHDTAGVIVIAGVVIVYFEMLYVEHCKKRLQAIRTELNVKQVNALSEYPPFWHTLNQNRGKSFAVLLLLMLFIVLGYHSRPYHRAMMLKDVAIALRDQGNFKDAQRVARIVSDMVPNDLEWQFTVVRLNLISGQHNKVLETLESMADVPASFLPQKQILMAYALMSLGRIHEAADIVELLPEEFRTRDPRVAMILAEMALRGGDISSVALHVVTAAGWTPNVGRIRNLYPYLRIHRQWKAMTGSDIKMPYNDPIQALSILEAYMNLGQVPRVAEITLQTVARWPNDMRVLEPLFFMAIKRGPGEWQERFGEHLLRATAACDNIDTLFETFHKCFVLFRPDLAWAIYHRIETLDPAHPALSMSIAKYGHKWFSFTKRRLGIPAAQKTETLDLKPFFLVAQLRPEWQKLTTSIPYGSQLATAPDTTSARKEALADAITKFKRHDDEDHLSLDMQYLYTTALEMSRRGDLAKRQLQQIVEKHPEEQEDSRIMLSEIYERKGDWINVYETLRTYLDPRADAANAQNIDTIELTWPPKNLPRQTASTIHLKPLLRLTRAQLELNLGLAALHSAKMAVELYPYSARAIESLAKVYTKLGDPESTLNLLSKPRLRNLRQLDILEAEALFATERFSELKTFCRQALLPQLQLPSGTAQRMVLPPAELAVLWHRSAIPSEIEFLENANILRRNLKTASSGLRALLQLWLDAYEQHCKGELGSPERWKSYGRDTMEKAIALNQLTLLLCREERFAEAKVAARNAVSLQPTISTLWKILISLTGGDTDVIARARQACPNSPELWLAELVMHTQPVKDSKSDASTQAALLDWVNATITEAIEAKFPVETLTRAGNYLWRGNMRKAAARIARDTSERARGLLPNYTFSIRCALHEQDETWALRCTKEAIDAALHPLPEFYEDLVMLKSTDGVIDTDPDMVNALRNLRKSDPEHPVWPQMLGYIRFQRGGWEIIDALFEMNVAIAGGATNRTPYLIAAEVSRLLKDCDRAADILHQGLRHSPNHPALLNNLAYALSQDPKRLSEAAALIPELQRLADTDPKIRDTLAVVYAATGNLEQAHRVVTSILSNTDPGSPLRFRGNMLLAEISWKRGKTKEARAILENILKSTKRVSDEDLMAANALLAEVIGETAEYVNPMRVFVRDEQDNLIAPQE